MESKPRKGNSKAPDPAEVWSSTYRLVVSVMSGVSPELAALGLEIKELMVLAEIDANPYPAALAAALIMPRPTVTVNVKRLEAAGFLRREIDTADLRRHRLALTPAGRKVATQGIALLSREFGARLGRLSNAQQIDFRTLLQKLGGGPGPR